MIGLEQALQAACLVGVASMAIGCLLRERRIRNEHWLWKKQRLRRARFLLNGGGTVSVLSAVALFVV